MTPGTGPESEAGSIGPREEPTEKKEPTLEQQAEIYVDIFKDAGRDVNKETILEQARSLQAEMSEEDRKELTMLVYVPQDVSIGAVENIVRGGYDDKLKGWMRRTNFYMSLAYVETKGEESYGEPYITWLPKGIVAFARFSRDPDEDSLGEQAKSAEDWEKTGQKFMSAKERMIAGELYSRIDYYGMDSGRTKTLCPGSRHPKSSIHDDLVPVFYTAEEPFFSETRHVPTSGIVDPDVRDSKAGVRRIVRKFFKF